MTIKKGASPLKAAPQHKPKQHISTPRFGVIQPKQGITCLICDVPIDLRNDQDYLTHKIAEIRQGVWTCVAVCGRCHKTHQGDLPLLFGMISGDTRTEPPETSVLRLKRSKARKTPRQRLPPYAAEILADPPDQDTVLHAVLDWASWRKAPKPCIVLPSDRAVSDFDLDFTNGYRVRVLHGATGDPERLFAIAQALVDWGAIAVELREYPAPPNAPLREIAVRLQADEPV